MTHQRLFNKKAQGGDNNNQSEFASKVFITQIDIKEMLGEVSNRLALLEGKAEKKDPKIFPIFQVIGTICLLVAWFFQNNILNEVNNRLLTLQSKRNDIVLAMTEIGNFKMQIDFEENLIALQKDTNTLNHMRLLGRYIDYCKGIVEIQRLTLLFIPEEARVEFVGNAEKLQDMQKSWDRSDAQTSAFQGKVDLDGIRSWSDILRTYSDPNMKMLTQARASYQAKVEGRKTLLYTSFLWLYAIGTILVILSQMKAFKK